MALYVRCHPLPQQLSVIATRSTLPNSLRNSRARQLFAGVARRGDTIALHR
jgi:hypothetical protein